MVQRDAAPFGVILRRFRTAARLTQEELAARASLSPDAIAALERGKRRTPRDATVELLADGLELETQERAQLAAAARASRGAPGARPTAGVESGAAHDVDHHPWWRAAEPTPLVDRVQELDTIVQSLASGEARLLTLTGPAGVGKTRLALAAAARLREGVDRFRDGATLVDLAPIRDPDLVLDVIARSLGLLDVGARPALERLVEALADRRLLMALDNFEQILSAAASLAELLAACPRLALLVTSREPLRLRWEQTLRVAPLPVPDVSAALPPPDVLPLPTLVRRLGDRLELLASQAPDAPERQRSLEAAVGWSYDLLSDAEGRLFRFLGVFVGRVTLDAIATVDRVVRAGGGAASEGAVGEERETGRTLRQLLSLAEKSLVLPARPEESGGQEVSSTEPEEPEDDEPAFGMLETVREYAWERLAAAGELAAARRAHARYFLELAEQAGPLLRGPEQRAWFLRLEREHDNLRAALGWLLDQDDDADREAALWLAGALGWFWGGAATMRRACAG